MEFRIDKFSWVLACSLCAVVTAFLFIPNLANLYFSFGRYLLYIAFAIGLLAIVLTWHRSYKLNGWRNHGMAAIKTVVLIAVFSVASVIFIASHSGI